MPLPLETAANRRAVNKALRALVCIDASSVAASLTGTTSQTTLATIAIPGGTLGPNGYLIVTTFWSYTNSASMKTQRIRVGNATSGVTYLGAQPTTTAQAHHLTRIRNVNSESSQKGSVLPATGTTTSATTVTSSVDTSSNWSLYITGQLADAGDTLTLEGYMVEAAYLP